jgi:hypothetical protein
VNHKGHGAAFGRNQLRIADFGLRIEETATAKKCGWFFSLLLAFAIFVTFVVQAVSFCRAF